MIELSKDLAALIDKAIEDNTFSLKAVDAIKLLRAKSEEQAAEITRLKSRIENGDKELREEKSKLSDALIALGKIKQREDACAEREAKMTTLEKSEAVAGATAAAYKDCLHTVFRPNTVRTEAQRLMPYSNTPGQYGSTYQGYQQQPESETKTEG